MLDTYRCNKTLDIYVSLLTVWQLQAMWSHLLKLYSKVRHVDIYSELSVTQEQFYGNTYYNALSRPGHTGLQLESQTLFIPLQKRKVTVKSWFVQPSLRINQNIKWLRNQIIQSDFLSWETGGLGKVPWWPDTRTACTWTTSWPW